MRLFFLLGLAQVFLAYSSYALDLKNVNRSLSANVKSQLNKYSIPGAAYAIVKGDEIIALESFGHTDNKRSRVIDENTVFRLASVSKPFAATVATMLAQENKLNLADPVTKFVPGFKLAKAGAAEKIRLNHILSHSSGLMPNAYDNLLHENWSMDKIISRFNKVEPICEPAKCYGYQNIAYSFIQPAIEASQSKSYSQLLSDKVFKPLEMYNASVGIGVYARSSNTAKPHVLIKRQNTGKKDRKGKQIKRYIWRKVDVKPDYYKVEPAAGVNASIKDLAKWLVANLGHKPDVLSDELLAELRTPRIKTKKDLRRRYWRDHIDNAHYGYGWRIYQFEGQPLIYHSGWVSGFRADIAYAPTLDVGFAVLLNAEANAISKISTDFWKQVFKPSSS